MKDFNEDLIHENETIDEPYWTNKFTRELQQFEKKNAMLFRKKGIHPIRAKH